jgi:hypothetical protein
MALCFLVWASMESILVILRYTFLIKFVVLLFLIFRLKTTVRNKYYSCSILLCTTTTCFGPDLLRTVVFNLNIGDTRAPGCITQQLLFLLFT